MNNLFEKIDFASHSGVPLKWKIECDALSDEDIETLAWLIAQKFNFNKIIGIPRGGMRLAKELEKYCNHTSSRILIVDDVMTTGHSMKRAKDKIRGKVKGSVIGIVIFNRSNYRPRWIHSIFSLNEKLIHLS